MSLGDQDIKPFNTYPHIDNLYKLQDILLEPLVVVQEKLDGTNMRVGMVDGVLFAGTRNRTIMRVNKIDPMYDAEGDFGFIKFLRDNNIRNRFFDHFPATNIIFYGEFIGPKIQKRISYGPDNYFKVFDVRLDGEFVEWDTVKELATIMRLDTVPELYRGAPAPTTFELLVNAVSRTAELNGVDGPKIHEGIVIKPIPAKRDRKGEWLIAKFKNAAHEERASKKLHQSTDTPEVLRGIDAFVKEFVTEGRLNHVLDHLKEQNIPTDQIESMKYVLKEMGQDISREGEADLVKANLDWKKVSKAISHATMVLYKQYLNRLIRK